MIRVNRINLVALFWLLAAVPPLAAAPESKETPKPASRSSDQQLLDNLDNELLEGIPPTPKPTGDAAEAAAAADGEQNPLGQIGQMMRKAQGLIQARNASNDAQELQQRIMRDLSQLIDELEQQQASGSSSSDNQSTEQQKTASRGNPQPQKNAGKSSQGLTSTAARQSTTAMRKDDARRADAARAHDLMKSLWGQLPVHERNQLLQAAPEEFLPKYELLIEQYYKRLAEEQQKSQ